MKNRLVQSLLKNLLTAILICFTCLVFAQTSQKANKTDANTTQQKTTKSVKSNLSKAEKYALDGLEDLAKQAKKTKNNTSSVGNASSTNQGGNASNAAKKVDRCYTDQGHQQRLQDPRYFEHFKAIQDKINQDLSSGYIPCDGSNTVVIPIAVHFDSAYNCSNIQCLVDATEAQINSLNDDFSAANADLQLYNDIIASCGGSNVISDGVCVSFCLANQNHPAGSGLSDGQPAITIGQYNNGGINAGGIGAPEWQGYLNMFVIDGYGGGVADGIGGMLNGDGVTEGGQYWGGPGFAPCSSGGFLNDDNAWFLGRTLTHEVGHYLGLYHTFQGGCGDEPNAPFDVNDTPAQANPNYGVESATDCVALATGCVSGEIVQFNFMDYFDDPSLVMFTNEQAIAMNTFSNIMTWANDAIDLGCSDYTESSIASCVISAGFSPADGADLILCTDDGSILFLTDESSLATTWNWTFTVTSGDLVLSTASSTMQSPLPTVTAGTAGTVEVTQQACDADGLCDSVTNTYNITVLSGDECPDVCDYTFTLDDTFGDSWDGAFIEIFENGASIGTYDVPSGSQDIYIIALTDGATIDIVYTPGAFENEHIYTITDPFGNNIYTDGPNPGPGTSFTVSCSPPLCDDGVQNGSEGGVDCGGASTCADCCGNGVQDDGETGVDCGGANCAVCPACPDGFTEIVNETFDSCVQPAGWTVSSTDGATVGNGIFFDALPGSVPGESQPDPEDFTGCIALISDDFADNIGVGCLITPVIDLTQFSNTSLTFDWHHEAFAGGGNLIVEVWDGAAWVNVFLADDDSVGNNETVSLDVYSNADFQIRFCYDDEAGFQWGGAFDNISVCGQSGDCTEEISGAVIPADPLCDVSGIELEIVAPDGTSTTVTTAADGTFTVPGGPYPCGDYTASITTLIGDLPACYAESGPIGPISFTIDGDSATADGPFFDQEPNIPTLSQWGLIVLALLLMTFGSLRLGFRTLAYQRKK